MKNKKQKTPKLPKYETGGSNFNEFGINVQGQGQGTDNIYNQKRSSGKNMGQYAGIATAAGQTAGNLAAINNEDYNGDTKAYMQSQAVGSGITQGIGTINPLIAMGTGLRKSATGMIGDKQGANRTVSNWMAAPHEAAMSDMAAANNSENTQSQKIGGYMSAIGDITGMSKMRQMFSYGTGNDEKTTGFWGKYNDLTGISARNNQKNSLAQNQFPMGGINMQPNAEVELEENTLNPDGSTTQYDGASHEQGGIKTNLDPGTLIFSDKLKLGGKTFAKLNKPNMTTKEDKILANKDASAMSKLTAELMKQAKNKSSIELFEAQESLKQSKLDSYTKRLGGIMKYPNGGITPQQYKQAQSDSLTLYNSGLKSNIPNFEQNNNYTDAFLRLNDLNKRPPVPTNNVDPYSRTTTATYVKPTMLPYRQTQIPTDNNGVQRVENYAKPVGKPVQHPNYNQFIPGINQSKQPVQIEEFKKGGKKGGFTPMINDPNEEIVVPGNYKSNNDFSGVLAPSAYDKQMDITDANTLNKSAWEADYMNNPNAPRPSTDNTTQPNKFDWKGVGTQAAYFAANNAGNIYDLARANKIETRKYDRAKASLLNDSAAIRDANEQTRRAEYNVRGASGGNAGTYLSNRVGLNAQNIINKDRIRQEYANANAGISNQVNQFNTGIANEEILANAKIRANARNTKQSAIASIGSNTANQMNDVRNTNMDKKKLDGLIKMYPSLAKDPKMLEYFMSFNA